jgi:hypothetical protein
VADSPPFLISDYRKRSYQQSKTDCGCCWLKDWNFFHWQWRQICHIHVAVGKVGDQAQGLVDAFGKLDPGLLQAPCINRSYPAQQKSIINCASRCENF